MSNNQEDLIQRVAPHEKRREASGRHNRGGVRLIKTKRPSRWVVEAQSPLGKEREKFSTDEYDNAEQKADELFESLMEQYELDEHEELL